MSKYNMWFCSCGRIHPMPISDMDWMVQDHDKRSVIHICTNCGAVYKQFLEEDPWGNEPCGHYYVNGVSIVDEVINTTDEPKKDFKLIFNRGIKVPMKSGGYATYHLSDTYVNQDYIRDTLNTNDLYCAVRKDPECCTVDTQRLIREVKDDEILTDLSRYFVGINWAGTKYE